MDEGSILIIDDEEAVSTLLKDTLTEKGYNVVTIQKAEAGINIAKNKSFDLVITDLKMSDLDGIGILNQIKGSNEDNVVVVITDYPSFQTVQEVLSLGAYGYIAKPFNLDEVAFTVKKAIDFHRLNLANKDLIRKLEEQNTLLEKKVQEKTKELLFIHDIGQDISLSLKLDEVLLSIVNGISSVLNLTICAILLYDEVSAELSIKSVQGLDERFINETHLKLGQRISGWVLKENISLLVEDLDKDVRFKDRMQEKYYSKSLISVPMIIKNKPLGVINVNGKRTGEPFNEDELRIVEGIAVEASIAIENAQLYENLQKVYLHTIKALLFAIDARDKYTCSHSEYVTKYAVAIAKEMGFSEKGIEEIREACQLHDLGKIGIHDYILTKPGKLTEEEWNQIRLHSLKGADILEPLVFLGGVTDLIRQHHERFDGKGYPYGYKGEDIKLGARIMAVADSYDAMITERPYRKRPFSKKEAIEEIKKNSGTQFDPRVVETFLKIMDKL